jgi:hypothetical protein
MMKGYVCAAGIDPETQEHVRPVLPGMRLRTGILEEQGGPFSMAALVDLGETHPCGNAPETEDVEFHPSLAAKVRTLPGQEFWTLLRSVSESCLGDVFGSELESVGHTLAIEEGKGVVSLGCLAPKRPPTLAIDRFDRIRALVADGEIYYDLPVTDVRLYENDHQSPRQGIVAGIGERMARGVPVIVSVGVTRAFAVRDGEPPLHWLQVNNLHLEDDPAWVG